MRRLDAVRRRIGAGRSTAALALDAGFSDQADFTRQFKRVYGVTLGRYAALTGNTIPG